jgi:hypothetical protein
MHTAVFLEQVPTLTTKYADGLPTFFGRRATRKKTYYCSWQNMKLKGREMRLEIMGSNIFLHLTIFASARKTVSRFIF